MDTDVVRCQLRFFQEAQKTYSDVPYDTVRAQKCQHCTYTAYTVEYYYMRHTAVIIRMVIYILLTKKVV